MWLNCHLRANQDSPEIKSLYFHDTRKISAELQTYMHENLAVFWKTNPCCYFCNINLPCILFSKLLHVIAPLVVTNWRSLSWKSRPHGQFKNCWTAPWKFSEWIYRRLRIISRTRSRATQESSDEIYHHFRFVNSSETFQPPLWFSRNPPREFNGQNILPERHSAFREL